MSENQANPGSEGTNAQPPVAGQSPESGAEVGSQAGQQPASPPAEPNAPQPSSPYQAPAGYDPSAPWMRPSTDPAPAASTGPAPHEGAPDTGTPHTGTPQAGTPQAGTPYAGTPAASQDPTVYTAQVPSYGNPSYANPSYGQNPSAHGPGSPYAPQYGQSSPYGQGSPGQGSPYGPGSTDSTPTFAGQTWPGIPGAPGTTPPSPHKPSGWRRSTVAVAAGAVLALTGGVVGGFVGFALHDDTNGSSVQTNAAGEPKTALPAIDRSSLASIAKSIQPNVVSVKTQGGEGSGVVTSADGYIVTNNHVVATATGSTVQITFNSGKILTAKIIGADPKTDLAVVKVDATGLTFASWDDSDAVQVGDTVLAIGSPLGLQGSVTAGIVSALHRTITVGGDEPQSQFQPPAASTTIGDAIQTDAPINPGNSGGALVDTNGKVVGINSAIATSGSTGNIGVGFAISSNKAKTVTEQLIKGGKVSHPYLGISLGEAQNGGAQVQKVEAGSPAAAAGIQQGDVITKVNDRAISTSEDLVGAIQSSSPGAKLSLTLDRNGSQSTVTATVGDQP